MTIMKLLKRFLNRPDSEATTTELRRERVMSERKRREIAKRLAAIEMTLPVRRNKEGG